MATRNDGPQDDSLDKVLQKINDIARLSAKGDYIFRGEPKCYPKVSSNLYRYYEDAASSLNIVEEVQEDVLIAKLQSDILNEAKEYIEQTQTDDREILAELQHYGGKTNLIDFTSDYLIALFFACDGYTDEDGRVILLRRQSEGDEYDVWQPRNPGSRVIAQKSVFVEPSKGFVQPDHEITVPKSIKLSMSTYLRNSHGITTKAIYNDIHGFIRYMNNFQEAIIEFSNGLALQLAGDIPGAIEHYGKSLKINPRVSGAYYARGVCYMENEDCYGAIQDFNKAIELNTRNSGAYRSRGICHMDNGDYGSAIQDFSKVIELDPDNDDAYNNRGLAYFRTGDFNAAIQDFSRAMEIDPDNAIYHCNRGEAWAHLSEWEQARADLSTAGSIGMDIVVSFRNDYESVSEFEQRNGVRLPADIAEMLGG